MKTIDGMSENFTMGFSQMPFNKTEAIRYFKRDLEQNQDNIASWHNIARCMLDLGKETHDKALIEKSIEFAQQGVAISDAKNYTNPNSLHGLLDEAKKALAELK